MAVKVTYVKCPRGHFRKTATVASANVGGFYVRLYGIRFGYEVWSRHGTRDLLGKTLAYGGQIDDPDGIVLYIGEGEDFAAVCAALNAEAGRLGIAELDYTLRADRLFREASARDAGDMAGAPV